MGYPAFASGDVLNASDMNAVGLWKIAAGNFSTGVTTFDINDIFSSNYASYRILFRGIQTSGSNAVNIRFKNSGGTSQTNYSYGGTFRTFAGIAGDNTLNAGTLWLCCFASNTNRTSASMDIHNPNTTEFTTFNTMATNFDAGAQNSGIHATATAYTGITVLTNSAVTFTAGSYVVYGYRN